LSKRSNLPGLRSGFVAGDAAVLDRYYRYRTYEGCALGAHVQRASAVAWADERHVIANRALYREKFERITPILADALPVQDPEAGFYHWLPVGDDDLAFARALFEEEHITVLPGSFIARTSEHGNPGRGYVRVAWVAELDRCLDAAERLARRAASLLT
jgi:N-succinyldiaminopimelate aminotransferase